jgi:hypothetical protein
MRALGPDPTDRGVRNRSFDRLARATPVGQEDKPALRRSATARTLSRVSLG